jgi:uncharacterized membrane protein YqaE (UPF0057 family)
MASRNVKIIYKNKLVNLNLDPNKILLLDILKTHFPEFDTYAVYDYITINHHYIVNPVLLKELTISSVLEHLKSEMLFIEVGYKMKGGAGLISAFMSIIEIGKVFLILLDIIIWFAKFIAWLIFFIAWLLKFLLYDLIFDLYNSVMLIVITICTLPLQMVQAAAAAIVNGIGGWMTSIFGWDQTNLTKRDKNSRYFQKMDRNKGKKCYLTNNNTVPFSILLGTLICPPIGVFMDLGATGWLNIVICVLLTLLFYIPGLVYALLIIYS